MRIATSLVMQVQAEGCRALQFGRDLGELCKREAPKSRPAGGCSLQCRSANIPSKLSYPWLQVIHLMLMVTLHQLRLLCHI